MKLQNRRILIISPHPDDEAIGCGGLIARAKQENAEVFVLYMCVGQSRQVVTGSTHEDVRLKEIEDVAAAGNFKYKILYIGDEFVRLDTVPQKDMIDAIEDVIADFEPHILCIPHGDSYNQDHRATFTACITALRPLPRDLRYYVPMVLVYEEPYVWTIGSAFQANFYLDTAEVEEEKVNLMRLHATQDRKPPFARSDEYLVHRMRLRGSEAGLKSAEAYQLLRGGFE